MDYLVGALAATLLGTSFVLQQGAAQQVPATDFLRLRLVADLIGRPRWLAGIGTMILAQLLAAWVEGNVILAVSAPLLATNLLVALGLAWPLSGQPIAASEGFGAVILLAEGAGNFHHIAALLASWPVYALVAVGAAGLWLLQNAFSAAPLHASLPAITAVEPVWAITLGIVVFHEKVPVTPAMITLQVAGLTALVTGGVLVARAPALTALHHGHRHRESSRHD